MNCLRTVKLKVLYSSKYIFLAQEVGTQSL